MQQYLIPFGRVCVNAGAGTGKTTTLIESLAEAVLREMDGKTNGFNPMTRILVITFGVEASRQLKTKLKERLRDHVSGGGTIDSNIWRFIESESNIQTIDAFLQALLREIVLEIGLNPSFNITPGLEQDTLVEEIIEKIQQDQTLRNKWDTLEQAFPTLDYWDYPPENLRNMIWNTYQKSREFCLEPAQVKNMLISSVSDIVHTGITPPFTIQKLRELVAKLSNNTCNLNCPPDRENELIAHATDTYEHSLRLAEYFADLLIAFDKEYEKVTRKEGKLTYIDIAYLVWRYTVHSNDTLWRNSLENRFDHILVDEFQDTNHVQYEVIKSLIRKDLQKPNNIMFIGDVKQSIYQWRSAEPQIFADLILKAKDKVDASSDMVHVPLASNFRSTSQLIDFFNGLFVRVFKDKARGAIASTIPYIDLKTPSDKIIGEAQPSIHVLINSADTVKSWVYEEKRRIAGIVRGILEQKSQISVRDGDKLRKAKAGDIVLLFRRNKNIPLYVEELRSSGINCAVQTDTSLFAEPDVSLIVDFLDWLANPESRESITRILRSPLIALSDKTLRYLASKRFLLITALQEWSPELNLPEKDEARLEKLLQFREDLRWDREGSKSSLIEKIVAHGIFDAVLLSSKDGLQGQANIWILIELVSSWEEDELLPYRDFVDLLKALRERATGEIEKDYPRAILADEKTPDSVKVMTIHAAKGLEFPIVIMPELMVHVEETARNQRIAKNRRTGIILSPRARSTQLPSGVSLTMNGEEVPWVGQHGESAILWLSSPRNRITGDLIVDSKIKQGTKDEIAEFWRLLYVAMTRAKDHIVFSIGSHSHWEKYEWNSWMRNLRSALNLQDIETNPTPHVRPVLLSSKEVLLGIEDLPATPAPKSEQPLAKPKFTDKNSAYESGCPQFAPSQLNPSTFPVLLECPRRYQYQVIWLASGLRQRKLSSDATGANPPYLKSGRRMSADEWGSEVHEAFRVWDPSLDPNADPSLKIHLNRHYKNVRDAIIVALQNFVALPIGKMVIDAAKNNRLPKKEQSLRSLLQAGASQNPIYVEGRFDLVFQDSAGQWILVDFKAEDEPPANSYRDRIHKAQMDAYAWLIQKTLKLKVNLAYLAYVHPFSKQREITPDGEHFEANSRRAIETLSLDPLKGLKATPSFGPNGPCPSCPYSDYVGGPCDAKNPRGI